MTATPLPNDPLDAVRRAVAGDDHALETVARDWRGRIRRWAYLDLGDATLAEDAVQETFVRLIRHIAKYDPARPFGPWLRTIVRNCCHRVRERQQRHDHEALVESHLTLVPDPEQRLHVGRTARRAIEAFETLTPREREVMHLCTHELMSAADAARTLGIAPSTARVLLLRARRTLRSAVREVE